MFSNFFRAFLLSVLSVSMLNAKIPLLSDQLSDKVESISEEMSDFLLCEKLGRFSLSQENEAFVRSIIDKIGINRKVVIRKFNDKTLAAGASKNAVTLDLGAIIYMYFDEEYFNTLTQEEKKFLVAHEASHAKRLHVHLKAIVVGAVIPTLVKLANEHVFNFRLNTLIPSMKYTLQNDSFPEFSMPGSVQLPLSFIASVFLVSNISKLIEFDADLNAARSLGMIDGGVSLFERRILDRESESHFRIKRIYNRMISTIRSFFISHPIDEQRIDLLKKFEQDTQLLLPRLLTQMYCDTLAEGLISFSKY